MRVLKILALFALVSVGCVAAAAQVKPKPAPAANNTIKASAAYSEVLLRKAELTAELEGLLVDYQDEYPPVRNLRTELGFLQKEIDRLLSVAPADAGKLSSALGKLMVRKAQALTDLAKLQRDYTDDHPEVKSAKRKAEVFETAIKEILG
jgi:uncharacterized protein involved in exopolysaccharide biosynthesis